MLVHIHTYTDIHTYIYVKDVYLVTSVLDAEAASCCCLRVIRPVSRVKQGQQELNLDIVAPQ